MATTLINGTIARDILISRMNKEMLEIAKPMMKKALHDIETEMMRKLGSMVISYLDQHVQLDTLTNDLRIIIKRD